MEHVRVSELPTTEHTTLIAAFNGWNDAADAATWAIKFLISQWDATSFAEIDSEEFFDFTQTRPTVRVNRGMLRRISWPANRFYVAHLPTPADSFELEDIYDADSMDEADATIDTRETSARPNENQGSNARHGDVILLLGDEPHLRWRTFVREILDVARLCHVEDIIVLGALVAEVPHTAPVHIGGAATTEEYLKYMERCGIERTRYSGPTGMLAVLQDMARTQGIPSISLWGTAPHYISATPNLPVSEALLRKLDLLKGFNLQLKDLSRAALRFTQQVSSLVAEDPSASAYVRGLEERGAAPDSPATTFDASGIHKIPLDGDLPTGEQAIETVEQWLRRIRDE
ncbi:MAG TPA: PAC2 family protein [Ktedonobacterales bacterium]|nr:PAC2 family protein [Ktedonobacterales bacterium]